MSSICRWGLPGAVGITLAVILGLAPAKRPVSIQDMSFSPTSLDIKVGDIVRWTNNDERDHTVVAADGSFKSGNLRRGDTFEHTFDKPGKFAYWCSYHPRMKGSVNVSQ